MRKLQASDVVYVGERISAAATAELVLKTDDAGLLAVRPGAVFVAEAFVAEGKQTDHSTVNLLVGGLRIITGWIGHINRSKYLLVTPTGNIGIRGTDHEPYVIDDELSAKLAQPSGTYDKVNRGGTTLEANDNQLDIDAGKVGFARHPKQGSTRALMSLLLPVILFKVPDFYTAGEFDPEITALSATADENSERQFKARAQSVVCDAQTVATAWLRQLDAAIARRDISDILSMFAPGFMVHATVLNKSGGQSSMAIARDDFVQSTTTAVRGLTDFQQRRLWIDGWLQETGNCERITAKSMVIEQGKQNGKSFRFESTEEYALEKREGQWIATQAITTQK